MDADSAATAAAESSIEMLLTLDPVKMPGTCMRDRETVNHKVGGNDGDPSKKKPSRHKKPVILFLILAVVLIAAAGFLAVTVISLETDESEVIYACDEILQLIV